MKKPMKKKVVRAWVYVEDDFPRLVFTKKISSETLPCTITYTPKKGARNAK